MACLPFLNLVVLGIATMAAIGHKREEKVPPGTMARRHCMESVGLRCANPTYLAQTIPPPHFVDVRVLRRRAESFDNLVGESTFRS